jgi:hypothetical protein
MAQRTARSPLVIVDSLVSFLLPGEDENSSTDMRALVDRCRDVNRSGGTVLLLHHPNRSGQIRGSSDFVPATDQGFIVSNHPRGSHRLNRIELKVDKSRYGLLETIHYNYADGRMVRSLVMQRAASDHTGKLIALLKEHPGIGSKKFETLAADAEIPHKAACMFLETHVQSGEIRRDGDRSKGYHHYWRDGQP